MVMAWNIRNKFQQGTSLIKLEKRPILQPRCKRKRGMSCSASIVRKRGLDCKN